MMFKFILNRFRWRSFKVYYTYGPGTFVLCKIIQAHSISEANRLFDELTDEHHNRIADSTVILET